MSQECHDSDCPRLSYTATSCQCGFTQRLIRGEANVASANRGKGLGLKYNVLPWLEAYRSGSHSQTG